MATPFLADDASQRLGTEQCHGSRFLDEASAGCTSKVRKLQEAAATDELLVERLRAGDAAAFKELVDRYQSRVLSLIWGILRDPNHVEDIAQQVFVKIFFSINQFDCRSSLYTWIHKIAVNECFDFLRKKRTRKVVYECETMSSEDESSALDRAVDCAPALEDTLVQREFVLRLLNELSPEDRSLLLLKEVEGYSVEELSAMTGMNENTVKVRLFRARKKAADAAQRLTRPATTPTGPRLTTPCFVN
jgi:RNA polymerase sigma-70 factor (ECF subfamily)